MKTSILRSCAFLSAAVGLLAGGLRAQQSRDSYRAMIEKSMGSGGYGRSADDKWDARVKRISGSVSVKASASADWFELSGAMPLEAGDSIKTGPAGAAEIYLDDQGSIFAGGNTEMSFSSLSKYESELLLKSGFIAAKIQRFLNEKFRMQARLPSAVCAVRGTEFAVSYQPFSRQTGAAVFDEGSIALSPVDEKGQTQSEYVLEKNTELVFYPGQKRFRPAPLSAMRRHLTRIAAMRRRVKTLRNTWKLSDQAARQALRERVFSRAAGRELNIKSRVIKSGKPGRVRGKAFKKRGGRRPNARTDYGE